MLRTETIVVEHMQLNILQSYFRVSISISVTPSKDPVLDSIIYTLATFPVNYILFQGQNGLISIPLQDYIVTKSVPAL